MILRPKLVRSFLFFRPKTCPQVFLTYKKLVRRFYARIVRYILTKK